MLSHHPSPHQLAQLVGQEAVQLRPLPVYYPIEADAAAPPECVTLAVLDCETTGLDANADIIDLAVIVIHVDPATGLIRSMRPPRCSLNEPTQPIPPEITALTGIRDADVKGQAINVSAFAGDLAGADFIVAHNAAFDHAQVTRLIPGASSRPWLCSLHDVPWRNLGFESGMLRMLAVELGFSYRAHRAMADVLALLAILNSPLNHAGRSGTYFTELLSGARRERYLVKAVGSAYSTKDLLKAHGYRWDDQARVWWRMVDQDELDAERSWLSAHVYDGPCRARIDKLDPLRRFERS